MSGKGNGGGMELSSSHVQKGFYYGWVITGLAGLMYMVKAGILTYGAGPMNEALVREFGWSNTEIGLAFSLGGLFFWLTPIVGVVTVKYGPRLILGGSGLLVSLALFATAFISEPWHFVLSQGIAIAIISQFTVMLPMYAIINNWWLTKRGTNAGLVNGLGGLGGLIFVPILAWLLVTYGWKVSLIVMSIVVLLFATLPQWFLFRNHPSEKGQEIDNGVVPNKKENEKTNTNLYISPIDWTVKDAIRTPQIWVVMLIFGAVTATFIASTYYGFLHLRNMGVSVLVASSIQGSLGVFTAISSILTGFLIDRLGARKLIIAACLLNGIGIILLIFSSTPIIAWVYAIVFGLATGIMLPCVTTIIASYYGAKNYAAIQGSAQWILSICASLTPLIAGIIADATGSFQSVFIFSGALCFIALIFAIMLKPPTPKFIHEGEV